MNKIIQGDCIKEMKKLEINSVDAIITDPPYGIGFMGKEWDNFKPTTISQGMDKDKRPKTQIASTRISNIAGTYDLSLSGNTKFMMWWKEVATECLRVLKPGGFLLSFGGTRTYHRLVCGIEDAGFEIRDTIMWLYGSGFPKSLNIGKQIDKIQNNEREIIGEKVRGNVEKAKKGVTFAGADANKNNKDIFGYGKEILTKGNSEWEGWGTALKPAFEPIVVARKPLSEKNVALNVLKWGTGGINIDACRVGTSGSETHKGGYQSKYVEGKVDYDKKIKIRKYNPNPNEISEYLKEWRIKSGLTKAEVDKRLGTNTAYSWWEGRNYLGRFEIQLPKSKIWFKLKQVLGFDNKFDCIMTEMIEEERKVETQIKNQGRFPANIIL